MKRLVFIAAVMAASAAALDGCDDGGTSDPPPPCRQCVASFAAEQDNTIYDRETDAGEWSAGNFGHLFSGWTLENSGRGGHASLERRALIEFDAAGFIASGSTVDSAILHLTVTRSHPGAGARWFKLHRVTSSWGEGASSPSNQGGEGSRALPPDATWLHRFYPDTLWTAAGGDFVSAPSGSSRVDVVGWRYRWGPTDQMTADVQSWLDEPDSNFGWIIIGEVPVAPLIAPTTKRFASRENLEAATRPTLQVYYTRP
jgi:hypothetical protein